MSNMEGGFILLKDTDTVVDDDSAIARGMRLRRLRTIAKLTSEQLAKKAGISRQSLSYWENANQHGLSFKGAEAITRSLNENGFKCDFNWLWWGLGDEPYVISEGIKDYMSTAAFTTSLYPEDSRLEEIKLFKQSASNTVVMEVKHDSMKPLYQQQDWIGGHWRPLSPRLLGQVCILEVNDCLEVRICKKRTENGYSFCFMTYSEETMEPFELVNKAPPQVALVTRLWRR